MAMMTCPECKNPVSSQAERCSCCSFPIKKKLKDFIVENGILKKYIGEDEEVFVFDNAKKIGEKAFCDDNYNGDYDNITRIILPDSIISIDDQAFGCPSLVEMVIPNSVKTFGDYVFDGCESLKHLTIPSSLFMKNNLSLCSGMTSLDNIKIAKNSGEIRRLLLSDCPQLKELIIPNDIFYIDTLIIERNDSFTRLLIPETAIKLDALILINNPQLTQLHLPNSIKCIGKIEIRKCISFNELSLPDTIETIRELCLNDCGIQELAIPESATHIGLLNLSNCESLKSVNFSDNLKLDSLNFSNCKAIAEIKLPSNLKVLGDGVFRNCYSLRSVTIPKGIKYISTEAFEGLPNLVLSVYADSYGEQYAKENNIPYKPV